MLKVLGEDGENERDMYCFFLRFLLGFCFFEYGFYGFLCFLCIIVRFIYNVGKFFWIFKIVCNDNNVNFVCDFFWIFF